jgi:octaprenyl-diphosphate synthase
MNHFSDIKKPIEVNLEEFDSLFRNSLKSDSVLLNKIIRYVLKTKGKQIRPILVMLSAGMFGVVSQSSYVAATLIELLHTASLVHDDVVDESDFRRGFFSVNALWKNKAAVLVGDYLLSRGMMIALENKEHRVLNIVSDAVREMSEGELIQIQKSRLMNVTEEDYYKIIGKKTASLLAACCAAGAASVHASDQDIETMNGFGRNLGIAFQIKDDLLDFDSSGKTGKPSQNDLKEQKISLPLIYTLTQVDYLEKRKLLTIIKKHKSDKKKLAYVVEQIQSKGGFDYAEKKMNEFKSLAIQGIENFPDSEYKKSLLNLVNFTTNRTF